MNLIAIMLRLFPYYSRSIDGGACEEPAKGLRKGHREGSFGGQGKAVEEELPVDTEFIYAIATDIGSVYHPGKGPGNSDR